MKRLLAMLAVLAPLAAWATPPHAIVEVKPGATTFVRLYEVSAIASEDPSIATVERLPSQELLITGKKAGTTELAALCSGKIVGIRVHVRPQGAPPLSDGQQELDAALKACPVHQLVGEGKDQELGASPTTSGCRAALVALFDTDRFTMKQITVNFDETSLQAQIVELGQAVKAAGLTGISLHYQGATLVLSGTVTSAEAGKLAVALYTHAVGGLPIDDDDLTITFPDGGSADDVIPVQILPAAPVR